MITLRHGHERGHFDHGWLDTRHTFSFGDYHDPAHMGFGVLRVINEDRVKPGMGFPTHSHRDMEIVSYVLAGALEHRDSMGTHSVIRPGEVQRMTAGTGVTHSEFNPSPDTSVHFLQIWIVPRVNGLPPGYEQKAFADERRRGRLCLVVSPDGRDGSVEVHQDAFAYATLLAPQQAVTHALGAGRRAWVQVTRGRLMLNGEPLSAGDGAAATDAALSLVGIESAEALLFDLG
jgi:redox-sensitive bicupin YhaK (pirin superfamily)